MIQITAHMRILVATGAVDFRKGIDGLLTGVSEIIHPAALIHLNNSELRVVSL